MLTYVPGSSSPFICPVGYTSNNWDDNVWTKRLANGIPKVFPSMSAVKYSAAESGLNFSSILSFLNVAGIAEDFLFRGAPDILVRKNSSVYSSSSSIQSIETDADSSTDDGMSHQRNQMKGATSSFPPEKIGEVFAGLHILLSSKILRAIKRSKTITRKFNVRGVLVDKLLGVWKCSLELNMTDESNPAPLLFKITTNSGPLSTAKLCQFIKNL